jgi:autotransporter-associated beta strand protein
MTILRLIKSIGGSPSRLALFLIPLVFACFALSLAPAYAINAQWDLDPISGDWNTADNWTPNAVPNGPADTATFGLSNTTDVSISANTEVNRITFTAAATNPYTITVNPNITLTLSGTGIRNNSGNRQTFVFGESGEIGTQMNFTNRASADNSVILGGENPVTINFLDRSTAASADIEIFVSGSSINFFNTSTAGSGFIGDLLGGVGARINFFDNSNAGSATVQAGDTGTISFSGHSSAGSAEIIGGSTGEIDFFGSSTAGSARILCYDTEMFFVGSSKGGTAAVNLVLANGITHSTLDISSHNAPGVTIGSLEGDDGTFVDLGSNSLTVGSNNLSTTFSGVIQGSGNSSLTKIGTGTFDLTGANTYGNTNINRGVLQVDGSITSNTFVNRGATLAGTGTIDGNLTNNGKVSPGSAGAPGMLTVVHNYTQAQYATLMIQIAGASAGEFSVLNVLGTANLSGHLDPVLLNGFVPTIGESFTFLTYGSVNGTLFIFNRNIDDLPEHWELSYLPTSAVLTVAAGNVAVPDQGSTFLLLMLGLLGLVTCRRQLLRGQP